MSTAAQISANQLNAQLSTGPRTPEGKSQVAQNATKHGLTASYPVIRTPEEQTQFNSLEAAYQNELHPYTPTELTLFKQLVLASWNIDRCHRLESELSTTTAVDPLLDEASSKTLARIESYRVRAERLFHRNLKLLKAIPSTRPTAQNRPNFQPSTYVPNPHPSPKVGRNEPCPCHSGKKFKFCCLNQGSMAAESARFI